MISIQLCGDVAVQTDDCAAQDRISDGTREIIDNSAIDGHGVDERQQIHCQHLGREHSTRNMTTHRRIISQLTLEVACVRS